MSAHSFKSPGARGWEFSFDRDLSAPQGALTLIVLHASAIYEGDLVGRPLPLFFNVFSAGVIE